MPITVRYLNDPLQECTIRPTPLISISTAIVKTGGGEAVGTTYSITLTGSLLEDRGFPIARDASSNAFDRWVGVSGIPWVGALKGPYEAFDVSVGHSDYNRPDAQIVPWNYKLDAILFKQKVLRSLFAIDGQRVEISSVHNNEPAIICFPRVVSIDFEEGIYVNKCNYTVTLEADTLLDKDLNIHDDGNPRYLEHTTDAGVGTGRENVAPGTYAGLDTDGVLLAGGAFIRDFKESWTIEADEATGETVPVITDHASIVPRSYRISHTMSAVGVPHYRPGTGGSGVQKLEAWEQAKTYVQNRLIPLDNNVDGYPNVMGQLGQGTLNLVSTYRGFNHIRTEEVGVSDGNYSVTEHWLIASGSAYENYGMTISSTASSPFVGVSIEGSVKGLSEISPSGSSFGGGGVPSGTPPNTAYANALDKYRTVTNSGQFGLSSSVYQRANNVVAVQLNSQPASISVGMDEFAGTISYSMSFDNRPTNIIDGVVAENISVNDTYPGDVFATIPVIGRRTGPVLQYIGGRTAYTRSVSIELVMDYTNVPYGSERDSLLMKKPSVIEPTRTQLRTLVKELSPENEPGVRKWFVSAPAESWAPKEGRYSFNLSWTYELDQ
jgi:hypothetical protein